MCNTGRRAASKEGLQPSNAVCLAPPRRRHAQPFLVAGERVVGHASMLAPPLAPLSPPSPPSRPSLPRFPSFISPSLCLATKNSLESLPFSSHGQLETQPSTHHAPATAIHHLPPTTAHLPTSAATHCPLHATHQTAGLPLQATSERIRLIQEASRGTVALPPRLQYRHLRLLVVSRGRGRAGRFVRMRVVCFAVCHSRGGDCGGGGATAAPMLPFGLTLC